MMAETETVTEIKQSNAAKAEKDKAKNSLDAAVKIIYLNKDNAVFSRKNEFLTLKARIEIENDAQDETKNKAVEEKDYGRIYLHRAFPYDMPFEFISVLDKDMKEIGLIRNLEDFGEPEQILITCELNRKYYAPKILSIDIVKEQYGFSYWKVDTDAGKLSFTLQDTYRSILKIGGGRIFIIDIDGNRYEIPDLEQLDFKSFKKIELFL